MSSPHVVIFARCVLRRARNPLGARRHPRNLPPIEQPLAYVGLAPRKPNARLNATQNLDGNVRFQTLELPVRYRVVERVTSD